MTQALLVTPEDIIKRLPDTVKPLSPGDKERVATLIEDAEFLIRDEFALARRDFDAEMTAPHRARTAARVIRQMVAAAVIVGPHVGVKSVSSTTGPASDSVVYQVPPAVSFDGVFLTDEQRRLLGLDIYADRPACWYPHSQWGRCE